MSDTYFQQALRRLDQWLMHVCAAEERRATLLAGSEAAGWEAVRNLVRMPLDELLAEDATQPPELLPPAPHPLRRIGDTIGLAACEREVLLVIFAAYLDPRYQSLYAVLHDDLGQRRPTERLLLSVLGRSAARRRVLTAALRPGGRLVTTGLVVPIEGNYAPLAQPFDLEPDLVAVLHGEVPPTLPGNPDQHWWQPQSGSDSASGDSAPLLVVHGYGERHAEALKRAGTAVGSLIVRLPADQAKARDVCLSAWRAGIALDALPMLELGDLDAANAMTVARQAEALVTRHGGRIWLLSPDPLAIAAPHSACPAADWISRRDAWQAQAGQRGVALSVDAAGRLAASHRLGAHAIAQVFATTRQTDEAGLHAAARRLLRGAIEHSQERPAQRGFADLVLRETTRDALQRLIFYVQNRDRVAQQRGLAHRYELAFGPVVLFAGRSGTGKTLAAEAVANALGKSLHLVDLATLLSKYIGETEKHVDTVLRQAEAASAVLFFDEADALFTNRREQAGNAAEQFSNVLVSYLLQRIERHDGLVILATNLRHAIDEAFLRRFEARIEFPLPNPAERLRLWELMLPAGIPRVDALDLAGLADRHRLSGGDVRNAALKAIFIAERAGGPLSQPHLERAVALELLELGRISRAQPIPNDGSAADRGVMLRACVELLQTHIEHHLSPRFLKEIHVIAGAPTDDNLAGRRPAVSLALFRVAGKRGADGLRAGFIVSAWSHRPEEENELLGTVHEYLTGLRVPAIAGYDASVRVQESHDFELLHRFWSSHGHPMRASVVLDLEIG